MAMAGMATHKKSVSVSNETAADLKRGPWRFFYARFVVML